MPDNVVSIGDLFNHLNLPASFPMGSLQPFCDAAEFHIEHLTSKVFITRQVTASYAGFPIGIHLLTLPRSPVQTVDEVKYLDPERAEQILAPTEYEAYNLNKEDRAIIVPAKGKKFPETSRLPGGDVVRVTYTAGYGPLGTDSPHPIQQACRLLAAHYFWNREETIAGVSMLPIPNGVAELIAPYRHYSF